MRRLGGGAALAAIVFASACAVDTQLPDSVAITCSSASECPPGRVCALRIGRCVRENADKDPPSLVRSAVTPAVASRASTVALSLTSSELLFAEPALSLAGAELLSREPSGSGESFTWRYPVKPDDVEGALQVSASLVDLAGNESLVSLGALTLDFTAPEVIRGSIDVQPPLARPGDRVLVQVAFSETFSGTPRVALGTDAPVEPLRSAGVLAVFQVTVPATSADGALTLRIDDVADLAGNVGHPGVIGSIRVDTAAPAVTRLEIGGGLTVRSAKPGFNQFTIDTEADAGVGDGVRSTEVRFVGQPVSCTGPAGQRHCDVTVVDSMPEGEGVVQVLATDLAGNTAVATTSVRLDFTAPTVLEPTFLHAIAPGPSSALAQVSVAGPAATSTVSFSLSEAAGVTAQLSADTEAYACTHVASSWSCRFVNGCALSNGRHPLRLRTSDSVGNAFDGLPAADAGLEVDCAAPATPAVDAGAIVWHRAPFGTDWSPQQVGARLEVGDAAVAEADLLVRLVSLSPDAGVTSLGWLDMSQTSGLATLTVNDGIDRAKVWVQAVDRAGNASAPVVVTHNVATVELAGPMASAQAPGLFKTHSDSNAFVTDEAAALGPATWGATALSARDDRRPPMSAGATVVPLAGGSSALFGGYDIRVGNFSAEVWVYEPSPMQWRQLTPSGRQPVGRVSAVVQPLRDHRLLLMGGIRQEGIRSIWQSDTWVFDFSTERWSRVLGSSPSARVTAVQLALRDGRILIFGGSDEAGSLGDTWLFDPATDTWQPVPGTTHPPARLASAAAQLSDGRVLLAAGQGTQGVFNDTWLFDAQLLTWREVPTPGLTPRGLHMVPLPQGRALLFGALDPVTATPIAESWVFDGANETWHQVPGRRPGYQRGSELLPLPSGNAFLPNGTSTVGLLPAEIFDAARETWSPVAALGPAINGAAVGMGGDGRVLAVVGDPTGIPTKPQQVWDFGEGSGWRQLMGARPPQVGQAAMWFAGPDAFLSGGWNITYAVVPGTWRFDPTRALWAQVSSTTPTFGWGQFAFTTGAQTTVLGVGANDVDVATFDHASSTWGPTRTLPPRAYFGAAAVSSGDVVVFGGADPQSVIIADTRVLHAGVWHGVTGPQPLARQQPAMVGLGTSVLMIGGFDAAGRVFGDEWLFDSTLSQWSLVTSATMPSNYSSPTLLALDETHVLLIADQDAPQGTWVFDLPSRLWRQIPGPAPASRSSAGLRKLSPTTVLLASGCDSAFGDALPDALWLFDVPSETWSQPVVPLVMTPRVDTALAADEVTGRAVIYGGANNLSEPTPESFIADTWVYTTSRSAPAAVGSIELSQLGVRPVQVSATAAYVVTGASGPSGADGGVAVGADVQLFRSGDTSRLFSTCASSSGTPQSPSAVRCSAAAFAGSSVAGLRVVPRAVSTGVPVQLAVPRAAIDVHYVNRP